MLAVTTHSVRAAAQDAMADRMNRAGVNAGLPCLMWAGHAHHELVGQPSPAALDPAKDARRWAEQLGLERVEDPLMDGTVEYRGQLAGGLPVLVWAIVDQARWDAEEAALMERTRQR